MTTWIASPTGTPDGDGSLDSPWDITTALASKTAVVQPGDTIHPRGGTYVVPAGIGVNLVGASGNPVIIKPYPGESVVIDGNRDGEAVKLVNVMRFLSGGYVRLQGTRITNSSLEERITALSGSNPTTGRGTAIDVQVPGIEIINNVIDNCGNGMGAWVTGTAFKAYGNVLFDHGWWSTADGAHGHGIYSQSSDEKLFERNVIGLQFVLGMHFYSNASPLSNFVVRRNVFAGSESLIGGASPVLNCLWTENIGDVMSFGGASNGTSTITFTNNRAKRRTYFTRFLDITATENHFYNRDVTYAVHGGIELTRFGGTAIADYVFDQNTHYDNLTGNNRIVVDSGVGYYTFPLWQAASQDLNGSYNDRAPTSADDYTQLDVNEYDDSRATLTIFNWGSANSVVVDLSEYAEVGDVIRVRNVQDYFGDVRIVQYTGNPVTIDMRAASHSVSTPIGYTGPLTTTSFPTYGVFVLEILSAASGGWRGIIRKALGWLVGDPTIPNPIPPAVVRRTSPQDAASVRRGWLTPGSPIRRSPSTDNPVRRA